MLLAAASVSPPGRDIELVGVVDGDGVARVAIEPSAEVARTVIAWVAPASRSMAPATVTTPVVLLMAKRPPASSVSE